VADHRGAEHPLNVDGQPVTFELLRVDDDWVARHEHDGAEIVILARGIHPDAVALRRLKEDRG